MIAEMDDFDRLLIERALIMAELMTQARSIPSLRNKWRSCLLRDFETVEDDRTQVAIRALLDDPSATSANLPQAFQSA